MAIQEVVSEYTDPPRVTGALSKLTPRRALPDPVHEDPKQELRRLVRLHANWTRTAVAIHHMRTDRDSKKNPGEIIPCLLPDFMRNDLERAQERLEQADDQLSREMTRALKQLPIWGWLKDCAGIAEKTGAILVGETDFNIATKASKLKMFFGVAVDIDTGGIVRRVAGKKNSYHAGIRTALWQAFDSMPKNGAKVYEKAPHGQTNKYLDIWHSALFGSIHDPRYNADAKTWQRVHVDRDATVMKGGTAYLRKRAMWKAVDIFVEDLYVIGRALGGLPVWPDYYAAKLGYAHGGKICVREPKTMSYEEAKALVGDVGWRPLDTPRSWKTT